MITTFEVAGALGAVFAPIGVAGAALGVLCAVVALVAVAAGRGGLSAGAGAVWIAGALLSVASGFAGDWMPTAVAVVALAAALLLGSMLRPLVRLLTSRTTDAARAAASPAAGR